METVMQAGAIVYRINSGEPEVAVVHAKKIPSNIIFPKGHIEAGETAEAAAERELLEEAGIRGKLAARIGERDHALDGIRYLVAYFLFRYIGTEDTGEPGRDPSWYPVGTARVLLTFKDLAELLDKAVPLMHEE